MQYANRPRREGERVKDLKVLGRVVLAIGVILLGLRWVVPAISDIELSTAARLFLTVGGAVAIFIGGAMLYWPTRPR
jgi:Na+/phosphate symporter